MDDSDYQNARFTEVVPSINIFELYSTARILPLSLTYFRYCLENENYIVSLHFAEILFTNDNTYSSLGKRIFDIYIQGTVLCVSGLVCWTATGAIRLLLELAVRLLIKSNLMESWIWVAEMVVAGDGLSCLGSPSSDLAEFMDVDWILGCYCMLCSTSALWMTLSGDLECYDPAVQMDLSGFSVYSSSVWLFPDLSIILTCLDGHPDLSGCFSVILVSSQHDRSGAFRSLRNTSFIRRLLKSDCTT
ncbi:hypothetical protein TEA_002871 [Camellia sinensis var. sinensis]|uniref:Malectin domain-containing protein n=1 Tax=Camellia sinensis var. sinensis TaxID=542762 RepID=A0A4S4DFB5_CAMSN|nr:hypothetical protein TEA_002871 [Camellia sinensis var. sinensis]